MFKIKDKWELSVLEKYGFEVVNKNSEYELYEIEKRKSTMYVFTKERILEGIIDLSIFYKLIKDDIIEEETK